MDQVSRMKSSITLHGKRWDLSGPILDMTKTTDHSGRRFQQSPEGMNASSFWEGTSFRNTPYTLVPMHFDNSGSYVGKFEPFAYEDVIFKKDYIKGSSRCIANKAYSWGVSSLLLLTFCSCTLVFATILVLLQTDVYWNSRCDRCYQEYSIYLDIIYLVDELRALFGHDVGEQSAKTLDKAVKGCQNDIALKVDELPFSRFQQWKLSCEAASTDGKTQPVDAEEQLALGLPRLQSQERLSSVTNTVVVAGSESQECRLLGRSLENETRWVIEQFGVAD
jgi:hypothetical protein